MYLYCRLLPVHLSADHPRQLDESGIWSYWRCRAILSPLFIQLQCSCRDPGAGGEDGGPGAAGCHRLEDDTRRLLYRLGHSTGEHPDERSGAVREKEKDNKLVWYEDQEKESRINGLLSPKVAVKGKVTFEAIEGDDLAGYLALDQVR